MDLVKNDFITKINLIKSIYPNIAGSLSTYDIINKFAITDNWFDPFDEYCLGCVDFSSIERDLFGKGEWPTFYVRIHKINNRLRDRIIY